MTSLPPVLLPIICGMEQRPIAFVDLETTGLSACANRITEIGVVTVDCDRVEEWGSLINPGVRVGEGSRWLDAEGESALRDAPRFGDIARDLARRLSGHLLVAHNARFDFGFLKAEFERLGIHFCSAVLCSAMLSRKLYPRLARHDMDTLMAHHNLFAGPRHRALPDANLVWQLWQAIGRDHSSEALMCAVDELLAGPVLPDRLDSALIDKLPDRPGIYFLHDAQNRAFHIGHAANLRLHLTGYFRIDRISVKALEVASRISNITYRVTEGVLGAKLQASVLAKTRSVENPPAAEDEVFTWKFCPDRYPSIKLASWSRADTRIVGETFGLYGSERKARNALLRLATAHRLCHCLLGISSSADLECLACRDNDRGVACGGRVQRLQHLTRSHIAISPLKTVPWPYSGPVAIRERADLHVLNEWRFLGTARTESEIHDIAGAPLPPFDNEIYNFLVKTVARLPRRKMVDLSDRVRSSLAGNL
jgi:DNA polymerase-3 subunit epsilon